MSKGTRLRGPFISAEGFQIGTTDANAISTSELRVANATLTSAQVLALFATPITVLAAPGAGKAIVVERIKAVTAGGTAYAGIALGEDFAVRYTDASGTIQAVLETTGWLDQTTAQVRTTKPSGAAGTALVIFTPVANAALVAHMLVGEIITGNYSILLTIYYRVINTTTL